jgi:hypothetical protein
MEPHPARAARPARYGDGAVECPPLKPSKTSIGRFGARALVCAQIRKLVLN